MNGMLLRNLLDPMSRALETNSLTLLDVRAAVEWVHKNIENFGGDRDNIMVRKRTTKYQSSI